MTLRKYLLAVLLAIPCLLGLLAAAGPVVTNIDFGPFRIRDTVINGVPTADFYYRPLTGTAKTRFFGNSSAHMDVAFLDAKIGVGMSAPSYDLHVMGSTVSEDDSLGVAGVASSSKGHGVEGIGLDTSIGSNTQIGVGGWAFGNSGNAIGLYGQTSSSQGWGVLAIGDLGATGSKSFLMPHPSDPSRMVAFSCLEGNESGTYFRGSGTISLGVASIEVPEDFRIATEEQGLTVQLTAVGGPALLWVEKKSLERIKVAGDADVAFDYVVQGLRLGYADQRTIRANTAFVPEYEDMPFGSQYPDAIRNVLVKNGTLNPDYTPNILTAWRMGWTLRPASEHPTVKHAETAPSSSDEEGEE